MGAKKRQEEYKEKIIYETATKNRGNEEKRTHFYEILTNAKNMMKCERQRERAT